MTLQKREKLAQLEKLLQSKTLHSSDSLKLLLEFLVRTGLDQPGCEVKEYTIANEVFGKTNYDPHIDSTVRVQAARMRAKLEEYYAGEGRNDQIRIELPKGHYVPVFSLIHEGGSAVTPDDQNAQEGTANLDPLGAVVRTQEGSGRAASQGNWRLLAVLALGFLGVTAVLMTVLAVSYWSESDRLRQLTARPSDDSKELTILNELWGDFFLSPRPILVVYSNSLFQRAGDGRLTPLARRAGATASPQRRAPFEAEPGPLDTIDHYTGVGEVMGVASLARLFQKANRPFRVKRAQLLAWDDVKTENVVVLGSPHENAFLRDLPQPLAFVFRFNPADNKLSIINLKPEPGQESSYHPTFVRPGKTGPQLLQVVEDYAVVSLLKGLGEGNRLLILAGTTTFATQAAAEFVSEPASVNDVMERIGGSAKFANAKNRPFFQVLLKVKVNGGVPVQISYVTHYVLN